MIIKIHPPLAIHEQGKRKNQEDSLFPLLGEATEADRLFIVCDGMGGHEKGEVASRLVCDVMSEVIGSRLTTADTLGDDLLREALAKTYQRLDALDDGAYRKMGTTLTLLCFHRGGCTLAHIGDSRIYHIRPSERRVLYKSRDHSLVYDLYLSGEITYEEMRTSPQKNIITRAMMPGEDNRARADITHVADLQAGDYFYLCSDGMLEEMDDDEIVALLCTRASDESKRNRLIDATRDNSDNHSAYLVRVAEVTGEPGDDRLPNDEADVVWNVAQSVLDAEEAEEVATKEAPAPAPQESPVSSERPALPEQPAPPERPSVPEDSSSRSSRLPYVVAALVFALVLAAFVLFKGCSGQQPAQRNAPPANVSPSAPPSGSMAAPVQRKAPADPGKR